MNIKNITSFIIILLVGLSLTACTGSPSKNGGQAQEKQQTLIIKKSKQTTSLYFNGIVSPIETQAVTSPLDGTVTAVGFLYGQKVKKDDLLVQLKSSSLDKDYQTTVSGYLTAKEKYNTSKNNIVGAKDLYDSGITSLQTFQSAQSTLNDAYLSYLQAQRALIELFKKTNLDEKNVSLLRIGDEEAVREVLGSPLKDIEINANSTGIALLPTKAATGSSGDDSKAIEIGEQVKTGQLLVSIGDMSGIKLDVNVSEVNINQIKNDDKAIISSAAFPGIVLHGAVIAVSHQANPEEGGGLPTFPVTVAVKNLTPEQQKLIHVGMSAKVQINIAASDKMIVPINAVKVIDNLPYVMLVDPKTGEIKQQAVQTGVTTVSGVNIVHGLNPGDKIVFSD